MVSGKVIHFCFDIMIYLFEIRKDHIVGFNHSPQHGDRIFDMVVFGILVIHYFGKHPHLFEIDIDENVILEVIIFPPSFVYLAGKNCFPLHHLEMINDGFWREHQRLRNLGDKTGFLSQQFNDPPSVPVPEDVEQAGNLNSIVHLYLMLVLKIFKNVFEARW
jgi:hypothetical protein